MGREKEDGALDNTEENVAHLPGEGMQLLADPTVAEQPFVRLALPELLQKANELPLRPGVYLMRDRSGRVIYVGKSRKLKNRVSQYFQNGDKNVKTAKMVMNVANFDTFLCDTEMEALTLENLLIKRYTPKYNIRLKDAKSYPYIKVTAGVDGRYPEILMTRKREADKGKYFGPYSGVSTVFSVIDTLKKTLCLPSCRHHFPQDIGKVRPCLYWQMGRCCGVCTGQITREEYQKRMDMAVDVLSGRIGEVKRRTEEQMFRCAEEERYEAAAQLRDAVRALDRLSERQKIVAAPGTNQDVVALYSDDVCACVSVFYIRDGALNDKSDFLFGREQMATGEDMGAFLCEHYRIRSCLPPTVLLAFSMEKEERETLSEYLSGIAGHKVTVRVPERGQLHTLCRMVGDNAKERAMQYRQSLQKEEGALLRLAQLCHLETYPSRIEAYDISNIGAEHLTAGMIVCRDGRFNQSDYRSFRIRTVKGTDDYASMREALARRLSHLGDTEGSFSQLPDLILLDGGAGHVGVIRALLRELQLEVPVFGMVKDDYHKTRALCTDAEEINIAREQQVFMLLYRIQEEVHRYTVSHMSAAKRKTLRHSVLEEIPGIGPARAKALLSAFGGLRGVRAATMVELVAVRGVTAENAERIWEHFHGAEEKNGVTTAQTGNTGERPENKK